MRAISKRISEIESRRRNLYRADDGTDAGARILARLAIIRERMDAGGPAVPGTDIVVDKQTLDGAIGAFTNGGLFPSGTDTQALRTALHADVLHAQGVAELKGMLATSIEGYRTQQKRGRP